MASRIIHLAIAKRIAESMNIKDFNRFALGEMLPDAYAINNVDKRTHIQISVCGNSKRTYDIEKFRLLFPEKIKEDELYIGYYLHLVQDICFREFVYGKYNWNPTLPGNVERLHNDYSLINSYVIKKYKIEKSLDVTPLFEKEEINTLYPFDSLKLKEDFLLDFENKAYGKNFFFTNEMADEFIELAYNRSLKEIEALKEGSCFTDSYKSAWKAKPKSLLETTLNTRELGGYRTDSGFFTQRKRFIRSDIMKYASEADINFLIDSNIFTVIDLRAEKEVAKAPSSLSLRKEFLCVNFPIDEGCGVPDSCDTVSESYMKIASSKNIGKVFKAMANAKSGVLFHCTAGKDRTGVVSAILLMLAGVTDEDIIFDYMCTKECNMPRFELIRQNFPELDMNIIIPSERYMKEFLKAFRGKYGNAREYFFSVGINEEEIKSIQDKLLKS